MKNKFFLFIIWFTSLPCNAHNVNDILPTNNPNGLSAITWIANGGRLGDNLLSYARAKWLSYKHNIPILYVPFLYSDQLILHEQENMYTPESHQLFSTLTYLPLKKDYLIHNDQNTLYFSYWHTTVNVNWSDTIFIKELKKNIAPRQKLEMIAIPDNCVSIAVHVRTGGNFTEDSTHIKETHPLRFTPHKFLIAQIKRLTKMFNKENIYLHIFTDHPNPAQLVKKFKKKLNNPRITFGYRQQNNNHDLNVLEDLFSMMEFDCLIRPESQFSRFVQYLGKNKVVSYPAGIKKAPDGEAKIDIIIIKTRNNEHEEWITQKIIPAKDLFS